MIWPLGIGPRMPIFNCILKQMLTSNETELKCLMETTLRKENKEGEHWLTDLSRQPFGFIKTLNYLLHWNTITVPVLLSECVWRENIQMNIFPTDVFWKVVFNPSQTHLRAYVAAQGHVKDLEIRCRAQNSPGRVCKTQPDLTKAGRKTVLGRVPTFSLAPACDESQQGHMVSLHLSSLF